ncbi:hypothetical protein RND81_12G209200 [Saponaria officinalis]|uniref:Zinc-ribbon 15 domain-containing protein n=1 Tax=Saponaria officinalis TaxID=3572 RepID=A0AAW1HDB2_SAPOF
MVKKCILVVEKKKVRNYRPIARSCSRCGGGAHVVDMHTSFSFCCFPFYFKSWKAIICTFCGVILKSYNA